MYSMFMVYLMFQPLSEARKIFKFFSSELGEPLPEKSYADDCRVYTPENPRGLFINVYEATFDIHFVAHLLGWWFKMMIIRDVKVCWICSIVFELLEITFRHWLPNFWECWWDHVSKDIWCTWYSYYWICLVATWLVLSLVRTLATTCMSADYTGFTPNQRNSLMPSAKVNSRLSLKSSSLMCGQDTTGVSFQA